MYPSSFDATYLGNSTNANLLQAYSAYAFREEVYTIWGLELSDDPEWATVGSEDDEDDLASEPSSDISFDDEE